MKRLLIVMIAVAAAVAANILHASAEEICGIEDQLLSGDFHLPKVAQAIANKKLAIAVFGSASSSFAGPAGAKIGYPARLEAALTKRLPGVSVTVTPYAKLRETAEEMQLQFGRVFSLAPSSLVIWQTGTVEAVRQLSLDDFDKTLDVGLNAIAASGRDAILMNMQYSPRTELIIALTQYAEVMRFAALRHEIPLFDRLAIMRHWGEIGMFDLGEATKKMDVAAQVHDCIGRLLAEQIIKAANLPTSPNRGIH
jgi:hypothetical protein